MSQTETQLASTLQALASATKAIAAGVPRAWYEMWIPPIVTVLGWIVLVLVNQKNNRDLIQLQKKDAATNRILDALDSYLQFLADARKPARLLFRDGVTSEQRPTVLASDVHGMDLKVSLDATRLTLASLTFSDDRRKWIDILHREAWIYNDRQGIVEQVEVLEKCHKAIISGLIEFETKLVDPDTEGGSSQSGTLRLERDEPSSTRIKQQQDAVLRLYSDLSSSASSGSHRPTKRNPDAAISRRPDTEDIHTEDTAS